MKRTNIYLDEVQTARLDRIAEQEGVSRAELVRKLLDRALDGRDDDLQADMDAIDASFGVLADVEVLDRGAGAREAHLDAMWHLAQ